MRAGSLDELRRGGKAALARALAAIEAAPEDAPGLALLEAAFREPRGRVVGVTGPPGVGKSTLISALLARWRQRDLTVGVVAVDPSSRISRGALLGDRTRLAFDPEDGGVFVRSMAARDRLGGLAELAFHTVILMRALFDRVVVETVGVGQSETEIRDLADLVLLAVQPASGDMLQFMKAGILEIPDVIAVTKADLGGAAEQTRGELAAAARSRPDRAAPEFHLVSATDGTGVDDLDAGIEAQLAHARSPSGEPAWLAGLVRQRYGRYGLERFRAYEALHPPQPTCGPFRRLARFARYFEGIEQPR